METTLPSIEFFAGVTEQPSNISLRQSRSTGTRSVQMTFSELKALQGLNSFTKSSFNTMRLVDSEGEISVAPTSTKLFFSGEDKDEFARLDFSFEIDLEEHWERFMRFMNRYAEANNMEFNQAQN